MAPICRKPGGSYVPKDDSPALSLAAGRPRIESAAAENADLLDAIVCLVAAKDFLDGQTLAPSDLNRAQREGWIWVRQPMAPQTP